MTEQEMHKNILAWTEAMGPWEDYDGKLERTRNAIQESVIAAADASDIDTLITLYSANYVVQQAEKDKKTPLVWIPIFGRIPITGAQYAKDETAERYRWLIQDWFEAWLFGDPDLLMDVTRRRIATDASSWRPLLEIFGDLAYPAGRVAIQDIAERARSTHQRTTEVQSLITRAENEIDCMIYQRESQGNSASTT